MIEIPQEIYERVKKGYGAYYEPITGLSAEHIARDVLSTIKPQEQLELFSQSIPGGFKKGKQFLEIGSGFGLLVIAARKLLGLDAFGVEPNGDGFGDSFEESRNIAALNQVSPEVIVNAVGESLPFPDNSFEYIFSTNVLEHVIEPARVIAEAVRVCRPGGYIQIVVPNYGSFFDGHYACLYIPYQPKWFWKCTIRFFSKKDPSYVDTLQTGIHFFSIRKMLAPYMQRGEIAVLGYGSDVFRERMLVKPPMLWAGLSKIERALRFLKATGLIWLATYFLILIKAWNPLIITIHKK